MNSKHNKEKLTEYGRHLFKDVYGELEPLTTKLMDELPKYGHEAKYFASLKKSGLMYCRKRNSFVHPMYLIINDDDDPEAANILVLELTKLESEYVR